MKCAWVYVSGNNIKIFLVGPLKYCTYFLTWNKYYSHCITSCTLRSTSSYSLYEKSTSKKVLTDLELQNLDNIIIHNSRVKNNTRSNNQIILRVMSNLSILGFTMIFWVLLLKERRSGNDEPLLLRVERRARTFMCKDWNFYTVLTR